MKRWLVSFFLVSQIVVVGSGFAKPIPKQSKKLRAQLAAKSAPAKSPVTKSEKPVAPKSEPSEKSTPVARKPGENGASSKKEDNKSEKKDNKSAKKAKSIIHSAIVAAKGFEDFSGVFINSPPAISTSPKNPSFKSARVRVQLNLSCYGTNLRSVTQPMDGCGMLHMDLDIHEIGRTITFNIPAQLLKIQPAKKRKGKQESCSSPATGLAVTSESKDLLSGPVIDSSTKLVSATLKRETGSFFVVKKNGDFSPLSGPTRVKSVKFRQTLSKGDKKRKKGGQAKSSNVTFRETHTVSADGSLITIEASLPGEVGHCGGYVSPLMVFLDDKRPSFSGQSEFPLYPEGSTYWVENDASGFFLAMDRNANGKIDESVELFGNVAESNGFRELAHLDSNRDGIISEKDKKFSKLVLWQDKNGDGISQRDEMRGLKHHRIERLSLDYSSHSVTDFGHRARIHETAKIVFTDKAGKHQNGEVADVWFGQPRVLYTSAD